MKKIDKKQQILAGKELKAKKEWKKPELKIISISFTGFQENTGDDGGATGANRTS